MKVAISGFGRIGRDVARIILERKPEGVELVAINDTGDKEVSAKLFQYDSLYGKFAEKITVNEDGLSFGDVKVTFTSDRNPENLPWKELGVELVIDSTGAFNNREGASKHLKAGAKKVLLTAPAKDVDRTIVMGVNHEDYDKENDNIVSNASCTTNCLAPLTKVLLEEFGIEKGLMTTIHAYTGDQNIHDNKHRDPRRARAAALSQIPTTTGAAKAVAEVLPEVKGKLTGYAVRIPTPTVSLVDLTVQLSKEVSAEEINEAMKKHAEGDLKDILGYAEAELVSIDYQGDTRSSIFDPYLTYTIGDLAKVVSWYDNEWGYSNRVVDLAQLIATN
ncbi:type I glyceraldehyde-3-phosphate dehydrogenase [Helcococcus kunzii]|uniref:type I glyceraldehyde-3-phosphate dehydrogenase n=1 Tax=Helcococcus kunzii TaxID=40091 RepID=UPI0024ACF85D|nr:type I glyceraldehyde-3-phosphate dehydrogenase [Helcococcus kunzii]